MDRGLLLLLLLLSPLLLGGNRQVFWAADGLIASLALALLAISTLRDSGGSARPRSVMVWVAALFLAVTAWMLAQASTLTPASLHHPIWELVAPLSASGAISLNPSDTIAAIGYWATLAVALVAIRAGSDPAFVERVLKVSASMALAVALFGFAVMAFGLRTLGLAEKTLYLDQLTGTFANANSAATYLCLGMIAALALAASPPSAARRRHITVWLAVAATLFAAIVLTGSRGGLISTFVALAVFYAMWSSSSGHARSKVLIPAAFLAAAVVVGAWFAGVGMFGRSDMQASTDVRLSLYQEAAAAIGDRPLLGHGAGTYGDVEPLFHRPETPSDRVWDRAHSSYLEAAATLGVPATVAILLCLALMLAPVVRAFRSGVRSPALLAALPASAAVMTHSVVDFSVQIQAVAILFATLFGLGVGAAATLSDGTPFRVPKPRDPAAPGRRRGRFALTTLILGLSCACFLASLRTALVELAVPPSLWLSDLRPFRAIREVPQPTAIAREYALKLVSDPYLIYSNAAQCRFIEFARPPAPNAPPGESARCLSVVDDALREAPASSELWLSRAEILAHRPDAGEWFDLALKNSYLTGAREGYLSPARLTLLLAHWSWVAPELQRAALNELRSASDPTLGAVAALTIRDAANRPVVREVIRGAGDATLQAAFSEALRRQSDLDRREADRVRAAQMKADCVADCGSTIEIRAAADTYLGPAILRLWVDGRLIGDTAVAAARKDADGEPVPPGHAQLAVAELAEPPKVAIEIEFLNDAAGEGEALDRNLEVRAVAAGGESISLDRFVAPLGSEDAVSVVGDSILFNSNGSARLEIGPR